MATAAAALCVALIGPLCAVGAIAAAQTPYPPGEPCRVTATVRGAGTDGTTDYDVAGSGLGSAQPVRVVIATSGQQVGAARTDEFGMFRIVVNAPVAADEAARTIRVTSPQQTCTGTPLPTGAPGQPGAPDSPGAPDGPGTTTGGSAGGNPSGGRNSAGNSTGAGQPGQGGPSTRGDAGSAGSTGAAGTGDAGGAGGAGNSAGASGGVATSQPPSGTANSPSESAASPSVAVPRAEPARTTPVPFGIGLAIAAVLLVLGTLAVLLLTRRASH